MLCMVMYLLLKYTDGNNLKSKMPQVKETELRDLQRERDSQDNGRLIVESRL